MGSMAIPQKLASYAGVIGKWGALQRSNFQHNLSRCRCLLQVLQDKTDLGSIRQYADHSKDLHKLLFRQNQYWSQRAKAHWLREGDSNTRFFHQMASARKRNNKISRLKDLNGEWIQEDNERSDFIRSYFMDLLKSNGCSLGNFNGSFAAKVSPDQNTMLLAEFSSQEIKEALFSMGANTAPGPNGFHPGFFQ